jgi:hypothetical protein
MFEKFEPAEPSNPVENLPMRMASTALLSRLQSVTISVATSLEFPKVAVSAVACVL